MDHITETETSSLLPVGRENRQLGIDAAEHRSPRSLHCMPARLGATAPPNSTFISPRSTPRTVRLDPL
jgi:hypothetical protein